MKKLYPKLVNKTLEQYGVEMVRAPEDYYYFVAHEKTGADWIDSIESLFTYNLEGFTIQRIVSHVLSFAPTGLYGEVNEQGMAEELSTPPNYGA